MSKHKVNIVQGRVLIDARHTYTRMRIKIPKGKKGRVVAIKLVAVPKKLPISASAIYQGVSSGPTKGSVVDSDFVNTLAKEEKNTKNATLPISASSSEKFYYARPKRWGLASFQLEVNQGLMDGGFLAPKEVSVTDTVTGAEETYYVYESINQGISGTVYII